ncbi:MAG: hypothetical protein OXC07_02850 [Kistimonas sp.]|nr:hypothetical protein [Kistimonas sp.]
MLPTSVDNLLCFSFPVRARQTANALALLACLLGSHGTDALAGEIHRQVLCAESSTLELEEPPTACHYIKLSKTIRTVLFGVPVTIRYIPVYSLAGDDNKLYPDGTGSFAADSTVTVDDADCRIRNLDVLFDFGKSGQFVFPLHIEDEHTPQAESTDYGTLIPLTRVFDEFLDGKASIPETSDDDSGASDDPDNKPFAFLDEVTVYSPFHPLMLAVMRHFISHPKEYKKLSRHLARLDTTADKRREQQRLPRGLEPCIRHYNKVYLNLAFFFNGQLTDNTRFPEICAADKVDFVAEDTSDEDPHDGKLTFYYNRTSLTEAMKVTMTRFLKRDLQPLVYDYSIHMEPLILSKAGKSRIELCTETILSRPAHKRVREERSARPRAALPLLSRGALYLGPCHGAVSRVDAVARQPPRVRACDGDDELLLRPAAPGLLDAPAKGSPR